MDNWDEWPLLEVSGGDPASVTAALRSAAEREIPFTAVLARQALARGA